MLLIPLTTCAYNPAFNVARHPDIAQEYYQATLHTGRLEIRDTQMSTIVYGCTDERGWRYGNGLETAWMAHIYQVLRLNKSLMGNQGWAINTSTISDTITTQQAFLSSIMRFVRLK